MLLLDLLLRVLRAIGSYSTVLARTFLKMRRRICWPSGFVMAGRGDDGGSEWLRLRKCAARR